MVVAKKQNTDSDKQGIQDFIQLLELRLLLAKGVDHCENCQNELEDQLCEQAEDEKVDKEFYEDAGRKRTLCGLTKKQRVFGGLVEIETEHQRGAHSPNDSVGDEACVPQAPAP